MNILGPIKKFFNKSWAPSDDRWYINNLGAPTSSGVELNEHTSLNHSAVFCAINLLSGTIGSLPLHLYRQNGDDTERLSGYKLDTLVHAKPNNIMSAMSLRETFSSHVISWGNAYLEKVKNSMGQVVELWPIAPDRVRIMLENGELVYEIKVGSEKVYLTRDNLLHLPGLGFDGFQGYSVLTMARESIGLAAATEQFGSRFFGEGTHPGMIAEHPGKLSPEAHDRLKSSLTGAASGLGKSHKLLITEEGMKLTNIGIPPNDSQFLETRQFSITEMARWFNLPVHKLKEMSKSSFNNIEQEQISYVIDSIRPWLVRIEQCFNMQLLTPQELANGFYFEHSIEGLLRGDAEARGKFYTALFQVGSMSPNDILAKENMPPIEGGDERFVPMNMVPLSMAKELTEKNINSQTDNQVTSNDNTKASGNEENISALHLKPVFADAARRVVAREGNGFKKAFGKENAGEKIAAFYETLPAFIEKQFLPLAVVFLADTEKVGEYASEYAAESKNLFNGITDLEQLDTLIVERTKTMADEVFNLICGVVA